MSRHTVETTACALPETAVISVTGDDAASFLQAQLSQDIGQVGSTRSALAAWHDPRGRVRALFRVLRVGGEWLLVTDASLAENTVAELRRFVLRARVELDVRDDWAAVALVGPSDRELAARAVALDAGVQSVTAAREILWLRIGPELVHGLGRAAALRSLDLRISPTADAAVSAEIRLGLPSVTARLAGKYVPQMLNLDRLGALAFDKGCYPGQEIIARTQNLGSVKRRARAYYTRAMGISTGLEISDATGRTAGEIIRTATHDGGTDLLAVVELERAHGSLAVQGTPSAVLEEIPLPFD
jgi:folate-binding protein YgfZ